MTVRREFVGLQVTEIYRNKLHPEIILDLTVSHPVPLATHAITRRQVADNFLHRP